MEHDPNFQKSFPSFLGISPENSPKLSICSSSSSPSQNKPPLFNQTNQNSLLNLNRPDLNSIFLNEGPSSPSIPLFPQGVVPFKSTYANESFSDLRNPYQYYYSLQNNNMDALHGYHTGKGFWDLSHELPFPFTVQTTLMMDSSLPLYYNHQLHGSWFQNEPPSFLRENNVWEGDVSGVQALDDGMNQLVQMSSGVPKNKNIIKGQWTHEEDRLLVHLVNQFGVKKWSQVAQAFNGRVGKQCRERWHNHLRPAIRKDPWTEEEDMILIEAHMEVGNKWVKIARRLPGRTENTIKNHWNATKRGIHTKNKRSRPSKSRPSLLQDYIRNVTSAQVASTQPEIKAEQPDDEAYNNNIISSSNNNNAVRIRYLSTSDGNTSSGEWNFEGCEQEDEVVPPEGKQVKKVIDIVTINNSGEEEVAMEMNSLVHEEEMKKGMEVMELISGKH